MNNKIISLLIKILFGFFLIVILGEVLFYSYLNKNIDKLSRFLNFKNKNQLGKDEKDIKQENCLRYDKETIKKLKIIPQNYDSYVFFCRQLSLLIKEKNIPYYKLGYLLRELDPPVFSSYSSEFVIKIQGKLVDFKKDGFANLSPNYSEFFKIKLNIEDDYKNKITFYYTEKDMSKTKIYQLKNNLRQEISIDQINLGSNLEINEIYDLKQGYVFKKAEIIKIP